MVLCVCCTFYRWAVCFELISELGDAAHSLSFGWRIPPCVAILRSAAMAGGFRKWSFLYTGCFGGSVCNAPDWTAHPGYRHSDASWGSTVDLCRFFKPDTNSARSPGLTFFQPKRKCSAHPMAVANHCNPSRKQYNQMQVPLKELSNLPHRHEGYDSKTFAIQIDGKWFGITYAFITHSRYESKPFDQKMTPYTEDGRRRYVNYRTKHKPLPCDRPSINTPEDIALSIYASGKGWRANFEYFMNREYAYNRDKGKCKCCGRYFSELIPKHCHHVNPRLPIERINKVPNLAWLCIPCHRMVHNSPIPPELDAKAVRKIKKYREKLKK